MQRATAILALVLLVSGCANARDRAGNVAWQNSTIDALLDGNYDGDVTFAELGRHGDFGIGTFDALDGEMMLVDGNVYQVRPVSPQQRPRVCSSSLGNVRHGPRTRSVPRQEKPYRPLGEVVKGQSTFEVIDFLPGAVPQRRQPPDGRSV